MWGKEVRYPTKNVQSIFLTLVFLEFFGKRGKIAGKLASLGSGGQDFTVQSANLALVCTMGAGGTAIFKSCNLAPLAPLGPLGLGHLYSLRHLSHLHHFPFVK